MTHSIAWQSGHSYSDIRYETAEGIAKITINRPERRNAFRPETVKQLIDAFHRAHHNNAIGAIILTVILFRSMAGHFTPERHFAFEAAAWYWHFVDVVWLGLFIFVYWM